MGAIFDTKTYNISEFLKWQSTAELNLSPKFQRNTVWNDQARSYLIDTILRGLPIPPVFLRQIVDVQINKIFREVIDGQQRLRTIIDYYNDKFTVRGPYADKAVKGKKYSELPDDIKEVFLEYEIATQVVKTKPDAIVYDMFARLNTNNIVLNNQEIRNAQYWGLFKGLVYEIGRLFKEDAIEWKVFTDKDFSRMRDYELINSLVIYLIDGIKSETPKIVNEYYKRYDAEFPKIESIEEKFFLLIDRIKDIYKNGYTLTYFNRPRYFYTLFICIDKALQEFKKINYQKLIENLSKLEAELESDSTNSSIKETAKIKELHLVRTTNIRERNERIRLTYKVLFDA